MPASSRRSAARSSSSRSPWRGRSDGVVTGTLRAGIIGVGFMGGVHSRAVRAAGATLARVAAHTAEAGRDGARRLGAAGSADTAEDLIEADDVDVVHVCTPNHLHAGLAARAL